MEMNHLIGQRFNLISKSDIRYVGTLHEINPEASTIALENVVSHGTEGRRGNPSEEIPASTTIYEYIVFRGSDVKDISVAEEKKEPEVPPSQVPDDPAILDLFRERKPMWIFPACPALVLKLPNSNNNLLQVLQRPQGLPVLPVQAADLVHLPVILNNLRSKATAILPMVSNVSVLLVMDLLVQVSLHMVLLLDGFHLLAKASHLVRQVNFLDTKAQLDHLVSNVQDQELLLTLPNRRAAPEGPTPPVESKPTVAEVARGPAPVAPQGPATTAPAPQAPSKLPPNGPKNDRFIPAIPIANPPVKPTIPLSTAQQGVVAASQSTAQAAITEATRAATAAVAAAMAKLPQPGAKKPNEAGVDDMTKRFNDLKPYDNNRTTRGAHHGPRGGRAHGPRGGPHVAGKKLELPDADFDFESSNAKFNKQDLVKEAIATGSPIVEEEKEPHRPEEVPSSPSAAPSAYNKSSSFFDNISSETRDREENTARPRERRGEEEKKNIETFGQGSVDGYRGYRGRGRGRGYGRGGYNRGYGNRGRGNYRGRGASQSTGVPTQT
ncbi:uncharacterized protein BHQ10_006421 [Talaromyces amestolkiae]|uniref:DFDF domain-containing protein n=1 Tax=Talaromyces amestolkiae TaxID=1196081 RepID=A0A364L3L7_TALAM|nr:uncharacterized protein BHQ10_006421 [Talaromyces amestolkiae]RAO70409.1 hypothetical protein BHQ10_006421 [Talaromyces amestolkiae]